MKFSKTFNNISTELKKEIPKLKPGEVVTFRMLNGVPNPDPDPNEKSKNPVLYGKVQIPTNFRIFDKYKDEYVDVGCVDQWNGDTPVKFRMFVPGLGEYSRFQGKFSLTGGNVRDEELYEVLYLSPYRKGSPCPDSSIQPLFEIIDLKAETKSSMNKFEKLKKAVELIGGITEEKAREIMSALNQPVYQDKEVLMAKVGDLARTNPDVFIETYESKDTPIKSVLKSAIDAGIITHTLKTGDLKMGEVVLATIKVSSPQNLMEELTRWISTAENGQDVYENIKSRLPNQTVTSNK